MGQMQNTITTSINTVGAALNDTLGSIERSIEYNTQQAKKNAERQLEADQQIASRLAWISDHTYHILHR